MLWVAVEAIGLLVTRAAATGGRLASSGVQAFGLFFKTVGVLVVLVAVAVSNPHLAVAATLVYALAYTFQLGLSLLDVLRGVPVRRLTLLFGALALALPQAAFAKGEFDPDEEFDQHPWLPIHLGPLDLSITKAVAYLWLGALLTIAARDRADARQVHRQGAGRRQAIGETIYEIAQVQVAEQGLPTKAIRRWFPYVATLMLFIWVVNIIGFIPLPLSDQKFTSSASSCRRSGSTPPPRRSRSRSRSR